MTQPVSKRLTRDSTFSQRTESVLRDMILDGELKPGERLNEVILAASLGISRGPLREAIQRLASEGLLTVISHRGAFVRTFERAEVAELYELRAALELHAVRLLCQRATDDDLAGLAAMLDETENRLSGSADPAYPPELDFHLQLVRLVGNPALLAAALEAQRQISLARTMSAHRPTRARAAIVEHTDILDALRARDQELATRLMAEHLHHSMESAISVLGLPFDEEPANERNQP
ncbi:GntR family transcriptional regulator [Micromonospora sp. NPDC005299]|uniref:GntR family transcriptional regulator n=1 Tax=Micromonospora sp. NPDC005299 TaxID=3364231 RepID=UPI0036A1ED09